MSTPVRPTLLQQREIEARVLAPLVRALRDEIGEERATALLRRVVEQLAHDSGAQLSQLVERNDLTGFAACLDRWTEGGALELTILDQEPDRLDFNVTRCRYAEMYRDLGLADLGPHLSCCRDAALAQGFDPQIELTRTQTIMEGAPFCDFRFRLARETQANPSPKVD